MSAKPIIVALLVAALGACSKAPTDAQRQAEKERMEALARASQEEEREKDRRSREQASRTAFEMTSRRVDATEMARIPVQTPTPAPAPAAASEWRGPGPAPATTIAPTTEDKVLGVATGRIRTALNEPEAMLVRLPQMRDNNTIVCVEVSPKPKGGEHGGFVPVIVTPDKVVFYTDSLKAAAASEVGNYLEFVKLNERLKCW